MLLWGGGVPLCISQMHRKSRSSTVGLCIWSSLLIVLHFVLNLSYSVEVEAGLNNYLAEIYKTFAAGTRTMNFRLPQVRM